MRAARALFPIVALACAGCQPTPEEALVARHEATIDQSCLNCHNRTDRRGGLVLANVDWDRAGENAELMEKVVRKLRAGMMPPPGRNRPPLEDYVALTEWLETEIDRAAPVNPGTKVLHRLNRTEYANAIRDLLGLEIVPRRR